MAPKLASNTKGIIVRVSKNMNYMKNYNIDIISNLAAKLASNAKGIILRV